MPEGMNIEIAHKLTESESEDGHKLSRTLNAPFSNRTSGL